MTYSVKQFFGAIIAAIIVAGAAGYFMGKSSVAPSQTNGAAQTNSSGLGSSAGTSFILGKNAIAVEDQAPGNQVTISTAVFGEGGGWVAIHEDREGKPGNILGAQVFPAGETRDGFVDLLRPTVRGVYYAMLHRDDGDRQFDHAKDAPITDNTGSVIMMRFVVGDEASEAL
ncbi:MAG: hypothetical protein UY71_C0028G0002 [Parcubacteria group bacterium GW2011_GWB1_52_7]|nr:MAG: hypothetical protein UY64_C0019G0012 [Parcubacteria group bacterium GW2011_GWA1_51_12]KKW28250.1 MAG: hypothetical protein UY71_C0028G0002 [Parcubacteria group bacterium GW2011_GWB1_52_7]